MCYHDVKSPEIKKQCNSLARKSKPDLMKSPPFILMYKVKKKKKSLQIIAKKFKFLSPSFITLNSEA